MSTLNRKREQPEPKGQPKQYSLPGLDPALAERHARLRQHGACAGSGLDFFPANEGDRQTLAVLRVVCARCTVAEDCLAHAIEAGERFGIWAGMSTQKRQRLRRMGGTAGRCPNCASLYTWPVTAGGNRTGKVTGRARRYCGDCGAIT